MSDRIAILEAAEALPRRTVLRGLAAILGVAALPLAPRLARGQVFAAANLTVTAANPYVVTGASPVTLNFGTVTLQPGGSMTFYAPVTLTCQSLVRQ